MTRFYLHDIIKMYIYSVVPLINQVRQMDPGHMTIPPPLSSSFMEVKLLK